MINKLPYSITLTPRNDWMGAEYTAFGSRVAWIKRQFIGITIVTDTDKEFQAQIGYSNLALLLDILDRETDLHSIARFA